MELPPEAVTRAVVQRYARLLGRLGAELGQPPLVLPTGKFFPDVFEPNKKGLRRLLRRMQKHAGIDDIPVKVRVIPAEGEPEHGGSCGTGSCGVPKTSGEPIARVVESEQGWRVQVPEAELGHPVVLTTNLARALGFIFLVETQEEGEPIEAPVDVTADLAAVALGFGVLMLQGAYIYSKSCGGPSVGQVTKLSCPELAVAGALFAMRDGHNPKRALRELETTQRALLESALELLESNPGLLSKLKDDPKRLAEGEFDLNEAKPWLLRVFGSRKRKAAGDPLSAALDSDASLDDLESMLSSMPEQAKARAPKARDPKRDELRALVDEALDSAHADAE